jgi:GT2 family glycosyltransferase
MTNSKPLSWGLVIATYQREKILPLALQLALKQTRKPSEVVVVDASANWAETRDRVLSEIAPGAPDVRWVYVAAEQRSSSLQRNQGLRLATADIVFLFDDDSLMYPTCAEEIMRVYEADPEHVVKGVQAEPADTSPLDAPIQDTTKHPAGATEGLAGQVWKYQLLWKYVLMTDFRADFLPYDGAFPSHPVPGPVRQLNVETDRMFEGYRMTFRRDVITQEQFEPLLLYYAAGEDLDASYRVSRHGLLLIAKEARVHHFRSASGRLSRFSTAALTNLNQALFLKKGARDVTRLRCAFQLLLARRLVAEALKDLLRRRWSMPQARGVWYAMQHSRKLFGLSPSKLAEWYPSLQREILSRKDN